MSGNWQVATSSVLSCEILKIQDGWVQHWSSKLDLLPLAISVILENKWISWQNQGKRKDGVTNDRSSRIFWVEQKTEYNLNAEPWLKGANILHKQLATIDNVQLWA